MDELTVLLAWLSAAISDPGFIDIAYEIIDEIRGRSDAFDAVEPILRLIEDNPDAEFGNPGPLVHFVENFYKHGYEGKLVESLDRRPTQHTLWMLNRVINGSDDLRKEQLLKVLDDIIKLPKLDDTTLEVAKHFRSLHV